MTLEDLLEQVQTEIKRIQHVNYRAGEEAFREKVGSLIAYFERHSRDNEKRADKLDIRLAMTFLSTAEAKQAERSSYYLGGKADAYKSAAEKLREVLGAPTYSFKLDKTATEAVLEAKTCIRKAPHVCCENGPCNGYPGDRWIKPEKADTWKFKSGCVCPRCFKVQRAAEKWIVELKLDREWVRSESVPQEFSTEGAAKRVLAEADAKTPGLTRRARRID